MRCSCGRRPERAAGANDPAQVAAVIGRQQIPQIPLIRRQQIPEELGRAALLGVALLYLIVLVALPLVVVFTQAFAAGVRSYLAALLDPYALAAMRLTLLTAAIVVPMNLTFGIA